MAQSWAEPSGAWYQSPSLSANTWRPLGEKKWPPRVQGTNQAAACPEGMPCFLAPSWASFLASEVPAGGKSNGPYAQNGRNRASQPSPSRRPHDRFGLITVPDVLSQVLYLSIAFICTWFQTQKDSLPSWHSTFPP